MIGSSVLWERLLSGCDTTAFRAGDWMVCGLSRPDHRVGGQGGECYLGCGGRVEQS